MQLTMVLLALARMACSLQAAILIYRRAPVGRLLGQSKRPQPFGFFAYQSDAGLIFRHCHCAIFGALFLPETCFCARPGLIHSRGQCHLLSTGEMIFEKQHRPTVPIYADSLDFTAPSNEVIEHRMRCALTNSGE